MIMEENIKMDSNIKWVNEIKINRTLESLRKNNMESLAQFIQNKREQAGLSLIGLAKKTNINNNDAFINIISWNI